MKIKSKVKRLFVTVVAVAVVGGALYYLYDSSRRFEICEKNIIAMDTIVSEKIYGENGYSVIEDIGNIINGAEDMISRYDEGSDIFKLNLTGTTDNKYIAELLKQTAEITEKSQGKFDLTVGGLSALWIFGEKGDKVPDEKKIAEALTTVGAENLEIKGSRISLSKGTQLDLGAIGKGFACDLVYRYLSSTHINGAIISVGGSILAYGNHNKRGDSWKIAVKHPRSDEKYLGILSLDEGFVSTSGDYERYFEKDGKRYHHLLDATTGYPAENDLVSVTVVAENGVLSDALSTAAFLLGEEKGKKLIAEMGIGGIFVDSDLNISTVGEIDFEEYKG